MLHKHPLKYSTHSWIKWGLKISIALNVLGAAGGRLPVKDNSGPVYTFFHHLGYDHSWWLVIAGAAGVALCGIGLRVIGAPPTWDTLHELVTDLQQAIFTGPDYDVPDHHKVTIFRAVKTCHSDSWWKRCWLRCFGRKKRWLVPVVRSHHTSQDTKICFPIFDDAAKCHGIAGQVWARNQIVAVHDLPNVTDFPTRASDHEILSYSMRASVSKEWIEMKKPKSRSILAMPLVANGEVWGALVFDSRSPQEIQHTDFEQFFVVVQKQINRLITKHL